MIVNTENFTTVNQSAAFVSKMNRIFAVLFSLFFIGGVVASTGGSDLDDSLGGIWDELQALATGNMGRILMICMILGGIYFSVMSPNLVMFLSCAICLLVLANVGDIIDGSLTATYDVLDMTQGAIQSSINKL